MAAAVALCPMPIPPPPPPHTTSSCMQVGVQLSRAGDHAAAVAAFTRVLDRATREHLTHPDLHVVHANRAASLLALGRHTEARDDAEACLDLLRRCSHIPWVTG